jgi:phenylacetate-CoA ligase
MLVEDYFGRPFYDQYATVEFDRIAWQCQEKHEYHIDADSIIVEFVDQHGEEVAPGEDGEIVCTSLFNHAMPFIRYALEDVGVPSDRTDCNCDRSFPMMKLVEGRKNSIFTLPGDRSLPPIAVNEAVLTFKDYKYIDVFRVIQKRKDLLVFRLKLNDDYVDPKMIESTLLKHLKQVLHLTDDIQVEVEFVDDIPLDKTGKFSVIISELKLM